MRKSVVPEFQVSKEGKEVFIFLKAGTRLAWKHGKVLKPHCASDHVSGDVDCRNDGIGWYSEATAPPQIFSCLVFNLHDRIRKLEYEVSHVRKAVCLQDSLSWIKCCLSVNGLWILWS